MTCRRCRQKYIHVNGAPVCPTCKGQRVLKMTPRTCPVCGRKFVSWKRQTCSKSCQRRLWLNDSYFGGRLFEAEGWVDKSCQICGRVVPGRYQVHHVYKFPDHSRLVVMCFGCHQYVGILAGRPGFDLECFRKLIEFALMQRDQNEWRVGEIVAEMTPRTKVDKPAA